MKRIAHRAIDDRGDLADFARYRETAFDGVELDIRRDQDGAIVVRHSPIFTWRSRQRPADPARRRMLLGEALDRIEALTPAVGTVFLDIKCVTAAEGAAKLVQERAGKLDVAFICWLRDDVDAIRARLPEAQIYYCLAPIFSRRLGRVLPDDLYLFNAFPYLARSGRFSPRVVQANRHNINVRLFTSLKAGEMPAAADGICLHRLFCSRALVLFAKRAGLKVAVYGLPSAETSRIRAYGDLIDIAIINAASRRRVRGRGRGEAQVIEAAQA